MTFLTHFCFYPSLRKFRKLANTIISEVAIFPKIVIICAKVKIQETTKIQFSKNQKKNFNNFFLGKCPGSRNGFNRSRISRNVETVRRRTFNSSSKWRFKIGDFINSCVYGTRHCFDHNNGVHIYSVSWLIKTYLDHRTNRRLDPTTWLIQEIGAHFPEKVLCRT